MTESVVCLAFDGVAQDVICLFHRGKLRLGSLIIIEVGMIDTYLFSKCRLDIILGCVIGNVEKVVEVKIIGHGNRDQGASERRLFSGSREIPYNFNISVRLCRSVLTRGVWVFRPILVHCHARKLICVDVALNLPTAFGAI